MIAKNLLARLRRRGQAIDITDQYAENTKQIGVDAQMLLENAIWKLAVQTLEDDIVERWKVTPLGDDVAREKLYHLHAAVVEVDAKLRAWVGAANVPES